MIWLHSSSASVKEQRRDDRISDKCVQGWYSCAAELDCVHWGQSLRNSASRQIITPSHPSKLLHAVMSNITGQEGCMRRMKSTRDRKSCKDGEMDAAWRGGKVTDGLGRIREKSGWVSDGNPPNSEEGVMRKLRGKERNQIYYWRKLKDAHSVLVPEPLPW